MTDEDILTPEDLLETISRLTGETVTLRAERDDLLAEVQRLRDKYEPQCTGQSPCPVHLME